MFFTKKKNNQDKLQQLLVSIAATLAVIGTKNNSTTLSEIHKRCEDKSFIIDELFRLQNDHWDKQAFVRLANKIKGL